VREVQRRGAGLRFLVAGSDSRRRFWGRVGLTLHFARRSRRRAVGRGMVAGGGVAMNGLVTTVSL
jgi:hypothetical protein